MADPARARKLADRIKVVVAETLESRVKDPRLGFVTITEARVTGDLQHATVFYTVFGDEQAQTSTAAALESARGVLRSEVGRRTGVRLTPTLEFLPDAVPENAHAIEDLLRTAAEQDAEVAALASRAQYAGEADPYRRPAEGEDDDEEGTGEVSSEDAGPRASDDDLADGEGAGEDGSGEAGDDLDDVLDPDVRARRR